MSDVLRQEQMRKLPQQRRSLERVDRILDAASEVFAEVGYDAATTNAIAERAGTSIGSLYRFFPDKLALFQALSNRFMDRVSQTMKEELGAVVLLEPLPIIVERVLDAIDRLLQRDPAFEQILIFADASAELRPILERMKRTFAQLVSMLMVVKGLSVPEDSRLVVALILIELLTSYLHMRSALGSNLRGHIKGEFKKVFYGYLCPYTQEKS